MKECTKCINNTNNPTITIGKDGLCNVCHDYNKRYSRELFEKERNFLISHIDNSKKYDIMVAISGGKDSFGALSTIKNLGFTPLAFTFRIGYLSKNIFKKAAICAAKLKTEHTIIDIKHYVNSVEKKCFKMMSDVYDEAESEQLSVKMKNLYNEGRKLYSVKSNIAFPFIRPCQICRKYVIRAYYAEAVKRKIKVIVLGINEWATINDGHYSAIRVLRPFKTKPPVYIVHLPFLMQRTLNQTKAIALKNGWRRELKDSYVNTGGSACLLANACEKKAALMLDFHLDSSRLARECTVGFINKKEAVRAIKKTLEPLKSVKEVLKDAELI
jgi:predicted PP-loop superfamily ATPase